MDLSRLLKKPKIEYVPEKVVLPEPEPGTREIPVPSEVYQTTGDYVADVKAMLQEEIAELDVMIESVIQAVGSIEIQTPEEYQDVIGKSKVTMSDYLESLSGEDYGPIALREVFEEHISSGDPSALTVSILDDVRRDLQRDFEMLSDDVFVGNFDPTGAKEKALSTIRSAVDDSRELRKEVVKVAHLASKAIDTAVWAHVLESESVVKYRQRAEDIATQLKQIRGLLKTGTAIYSLDWQSAVGSLRDRLKGALMDQMMRKMFSSYNRAYNKMVAPLDKVLRFLGDSRAADIEEVQHLKEVIARPIDEIRRKVSDTTTDLYAIRNQKTTLRVNGVKAVGAMAYTWRLVSQLDLIIAALTELSGSGASLEVDAPKGALGKLLEEDRIKKLSAAEAAAVTAANPGLYDKVMSTLPSVPEFRA